MLSLNDVGFIEFNSIKNQELANRDKVRKKESVLIISSGNYTACKIEYMQTSLDRRMNQPVHKYTYMQPPVPIRSNKLSNLGVYVSFCIGGQAKGCKIR